MRRTVFNSMIWNVIRGTRLVTCAIEGPAGSGTIWINGAAARDHRPTVVLVDERNRVTARGAMEVPGPARRAG